MKSAVKELLKVILYVIVGDPRARKLRKMEKKTTTTKI